MSNQDRGPAKRKVKPVEAPQSLLDFDLGEGESSDDSDFRIEDHAEESDDYSINTDDEKKKDGKSSSSDEESGSEEEDGECFKTSSNKIGDEMSVAELLERAKQQDFKFPGDIANLLICAGCLGSRSDDFNEIVECDGCGVTVHEGCYGVSDVASESSTVSSASTEPWFCEACKAGVKDPNCELCPNKGGIFKETEVGAWVHLVCALYVPGVAFSEVERLSGVTLFEMAYSRWGARSCALCEDATLARTGVCVGCDAGLCKTFFHVTCGQRAGLLAEAHSEEAEQADPFYAHCRLHSDKTLVKKRKRNWLALQLRTARRKMELQNNLSAEEKARIQRKLVKYTRKYTQQKENRNPPWVPTQKMARMLYSSASAMRKFQRKAECMGIDTHALEFQDAQMAALKDVSRRWHIPPAFSVEFVGYYLERNARVTSLRQSLERLTKENEKMLAEDEHLRADYDEASKENTEKLAELSAARQSLQKLYDAIIALCPKKTPPAILEDRPLLPPEIPRSTPKVTPQQLQKRSMSVPTAAALKMGVGFPLSDNPDARHGKVLSTSFEAGAGGDGAVAGRECCVCGARSEAALMAACDTCRRHYHLHCLNPPLARPPKKSKLYGWQCSECDKTSDSEPEVMEKKVPRRSRIRYSKDGSIIHEPASPPSATDSPPKKDKPHVHKTEKITKVATPYASNATPIKVTIKPFDFSSDGYEKVEKKDKKIKNSKSKDHMSNSSESDVKKPKPCLTFPALTNTPLMSITPIVADSPNDSHNENSNASISVASGKDSLVSPTLSFSFLLNDEKIPKVATPYASNASPIKVTIKPFDLSSEGNEKVKKKDENIKNYKSKDHMSDSSVSDVKKLKLSLTSPALTNTPLMSITPIVADSPNDSHNENSNESISVASGKDSLLSPTLSFSFLLNDEKIPKVATPYASNASPIKVTIKPFDLSSEGNEKVKKKDENIKNYKSKDHMSDSSVSDVKKLKLSLTSPALTNTPLMSITPIVADSPNDSHNENSIESISVASGKDSLLSPTLSFSFLLNDEKIPKVATPYASNASPIKVTIKPFDLSSEGNEKVKKKDENIKNYKSKDHMSDSSVSDVKKLKLSLTSPALTNTPLMSITPIVADSPNDSHNENSIESISVASGKDSLLSPTLSFSFLLNDEKIPKVATPYASNASPIKVTIKPFDLSSEGNEKVKKKDENIKNYKSKDHMSDSSDVKKLKLSLTSPALTNTPLMSISPIVADSPNDSHNENSNESMSVASGKDSLMSPILSFSFLLNDEKILKVATPSASNASPIKVTIKPFDFSSDGNEEVKKKDKKIKKSKSKDHMSNSSESDGKKLKRSFTSPTLTNTPLMSITPIVADSPNDSHNENSNASMIVASGKESLMSPNLSFSSLLNEAKEKERDSKAIESSIENTLANLSSDIATYKANRKRRKEKHRSRYSPDLLRSPSKHKHKRKKKTQDMENPNDTPHPRITIKIKPIPKPDGSLGTQMFYVPTDSNDGPPPAVMKKLSKHAEQEAKQNPAQPATDAITAEPSTATPTTPVPAKTQEDKPPEAKTKKPTPPTKTTKPKRSRGGRPQGTNETSTPPAALTPLTHCDVCSEPGNNTNLVRCDECSKRYHFTCLEPPLNKNPKKRGYSWHCADCDPTDPEENN